MFPYSLCLPSAGQILSFVSLMLAVDLLSSLALSDWSRLDSYLQYLITLKHRACLRFPLSPIIYLQFLYSKYLTDSKFYFWKKFVVEIGNLGLSLTNVKTRHLGLSLTNVETRHLDLSLTK